MQSRLTRSTTESMVAGVCGGLAEYFNIDPVIVRLIFVLVTLTSGLGIPVYLVLWILMPKANAALKQNLQQGFQDFSQEATRFGQEVGQEAARVGREVFASQRSSQGQSRSGASAAPPEYRFDPFTGQPIAPESSQTGATVNLTPPQQQLPEVYGTPPQPVSRGRRWRTLGTILIGIGGLIFLEQIGIDMSIIFPVLLIIAGVVLLRRKR